MTKAETEKLLHLLRECYPHAALSRDREAAFRLALEPYDYATARAALLEHLRTKAFVPTPGDLARLCQQRQPCPTGGGADSAADWSPEYCADILAYARSLGIDPARFPNIRSKAALRHTQTRRNV